MLHGMERSHALDLDDGGARPAHLGAHLVEEVGEIHDLGLAGGVVDGGDAPGVHGGHHEVLRGSHAREVQRDGRTREPLGRGRIDVAMIDAEGDA